MVARCPDTVYGEHGEPRRDGRCPWCGSKVSNAQPAPAGHVLAPSQASSAYRYFYDPDYGDEDGEVYAP